MERRYADRRDQYKKSFDDPRRKRDKMLVQIRKATRDDNLMKKRSSGMEATPSQNSNTSILQNSSTSIFNTHTPLSDPQAFTQRGGFDDGMEDAGVVGLSAETLKAMDRHLPNAELTPRMKEQIWEDMVQGVMGNDPQKHYEASAAFRKLLSIEQSPPIQDVINCGVIPYFVQFLTLNDNPELQFEAAWTLTNVASGNTMQTAAVVAENAVPIFVSLIKSPRDEVSEQAVWALGNIAGDCHEYRDLVLQSGALTPLLAALEQERKLSFVRNATWTLSNLCRGKPTPNFTLVSQALPTLKILIHSDDPEILNDACWALSYLSDGDCEQIDAVLNAGVCERLVQLLSHHSYNVQTPALRAVGNIVTGTDLQTQVVLEYPTLQSLHQLLFSPRRALKREACWAVSNITAGTQAQIQAVIENNLMPQLIKLLSEVEFDIQKEAAWAVANATSGGNSDQVNYIVSLGGIEPLCNLLRVHDNRVLIIVLDALENILKTGKEKQAQANLDANPYCEYFEMGECLQIIDRLQDHKNKEVASKAWKIVYYFFQLEDDLYPEYKENDDISSLKAPQGGFDFSTRQ